MGESPHGDTVSEQWMAMRFFHSKTVSGWQGHHPTARQQADGEVAIPQWADGKVAIPRRDSEWKARELSHGETVSGWWGSHPTVSGWQSHHTARQQADGKGAIARQDSEHEQIVRESSHGDTSSVQRIVRILVLTSDRACSGAANPWAVDPCADEQRNCGGEWQCVFCVD